MFANFGDTLNQGTMMIILGMAMLFHFGKKFAEKDPDTAKRVGKAVGKRALKTGFKTGIGLIRFIRK